MLEADGGAAAPAPTSTVTPTEPAPEPPPPPVWSPRALWDPAGDPGPCRVAAGAWRAQGVAATVLADALSEIGDPLPGFWEGEAADGQQQSSVNLITEIREAAAQCTGIADGLDELADEIEGFNDSIHELWIAVASIAAVSIVGAFFTFGASLAADAAVTAGFVARATALGRALWATISALRVARFASQATRFAGLAARWSKVVEGISITPRLVAPGSRLVRFGGFYAGMGRVFVAGLPFTFGNKALSGGNPFDPGQWRVEDLTASLVGSALFGGVAGRLTPLGGQVVRPAVWPGSRLAYLGQLGTGGINGLGRGVMMGSMAEPVGRFLIYDNPLTEKEAFQAGLSGWGATGTGFGLQQLWTGISGPATGAMGIVRSGVIFVPSTLIALYGTLRYGTKIQPQTGTPLFPGYAQAPALPSDFWQSVPGVPAPSAPPPPRLLEPGEVLDSPTTEPLRVVVRPGESMWELAERAYGDGREYKRIWLANNFLLQEPHNPDLIHPGQELIIPPLPASR